MSHSQCPLAKDGHFLHRSLESSLISLTDFILITSDSHFLSCNWILMFRTAIKLYFRLSIKYFNSSILWLLLKSIILEHNMTSLILANCLILRLDKYNIQSYSRIFLIDRQLILDFLILRILTIWSLLWSFNKRWSCFILIRSWYIFSFLICNFLSNNHTLCLMKVIQEAQEKSKSAIFIFQFA